MRRRIARTLVTALVTGAASCAVAAPAQAGGAYITNERSADVSQYAIGAAGLLSGLTTPTVAAGNAPEDVAVTPDGKSAYVVNISDNSVSQYNIDPLTGGLSPKTPATVAAGGGPLHIAVTPNGKSAYVTDGNTGTNRVSQYSIDPVSGALSPKNPATVPAGSVPEDVAVAPNGSSAYVTNLLDATVSQYNIDPVSGALSPKSPAFADAGLGPQHVAVTPDGKSAYVTNANSGFGNNLSQFNIDPVSGTLSPKNPATVATGTGPTGVAVSSDGKSAYVANFNSNNVSQYDIDSASGVLSPKNPATVATDSGPISVAVTPLVRVPTSVNQCLHGGFAQFGFKNVGQCVKFVVLTRVCGILDRHGIKAKFCPPEPPRRP